MPYHEVHGRAAASRGGKTVQRSSVAYGQGAAAPEDCASCGTAGVNDTAKRPPGRVQLLRQSCVASATSEMRVPPFGPHLCDIRHGIVVYIDLAEAHGRQKHETNLAMLERSVTGLNKVGTDRA